MASPSTTSPRWAASYARALLLLNGFAPANPDADHCYLRWPTWSPDGTLVTFSILHPTGQDIYSVSLKAVARAAAGRHEPLEVTSAMASYLGAASLLRPVWMPHSTILTVEGPSLRTLEEWDVATGTDRALFTIQPGVKGLCDLSWVPDGKQLVINICSPISGDIAGPAAKLYAYTPPRV